MILVDEIKNQIDVMLHPGSAIKAPMDLKDALVYYYKVAIIPMVLFILFGSIFYNSGSFGMLTKYFGVGSTAVTIGLGIFIFLVLEPIGMFIDSALYQLFGKYVFKKYKSGYGNTFTGVMYGISTMMLFYWLTVIPVIGSVLLLIIVIWSFVVQIIGLSKLQKISAWTSFGVILGSVIVVLIIAMITVAAIGLSLV
jgi:hypothetical protein